MGTSIEQIEQHLEVDEIPYTTVDGVIKVVCSMNNFVSPLSGNRTVDTFVHVSKNGESVELRCPRLYDLRTAVDRGIVCELLMSLNFQTPLFAWELDRFDGEIRGTVGLVLGEGHLPPHAIRQAIELMARTVDLWHTTIQRAITTGDLPPMPAARHEPRLENLFKDAGGFDQVRGLFYRGRQQPET